MNPNPVFKVRIFFDAEYLQNGCRYGISYYGRRIGNHTQAFEWDLSNRAFFNDLEGPHTQISISGHSLTLNTSKMAADTAIVTMEGE